MRKRTVIALAMLLGMSLARCDCHGTPGDLSVGLGDAWLARDKAGDQPTTVFSPTDTVWCLAKVRNPKASTVIKASWYIVAAGGFDGETLLGSKGMAGQNEDLHMWLRPSEPLPSGRYRVDLLLGDRVARTLAFEVKAGD